MTDTALQLLLFEQEDRTQSNLIALYDLAPRFVFQERPALSMDLTQESAIQNQYVDSRRRTFSVKGQEYTLVIQPARLHRPVPPAITDGASSGSMTASEERMIAVEVFPGEREQIVEQVVRRLAMERSRLSLTGQNRDQVRIHLSLYQIQRELASVNHTLSISQIKEAIEILARSRITIMKVRRDEDNGAPRRTALLDSTAFPSMAIRSRNGMGGEDDDEETYLDFNPLVSAAIQNLDYRPVSYAWLMKLKSPVSRWLYNRLAIEYERVGSPIDAENVGGLTLTADEIIRSSGMNEWSRRRDTLRVVTSAVDALVTEGILTAAEKESVQAGRRIVDMNYTLRPSRKFLEQVIKADTVMQISEEILREAKAVEPARGFVSVPLAQAPDVRRKRGKRLGQASLPLLPEN